MYYYLWPSGGDGKHGNVADKCLCLLIDLSTYELLVHVNTCLYCKIAKIAKIDVDEYIVVEYDFVRGYHIINALIYAFVTKNKNYVV